MKKIVAFVLVFLLCVGFMSCGKSKAARQCEDLINQIGTPSLTSKEAIEMAEAAVALLSSEEKMEIIESVTKLPTLRAEYENLVAEAELKARLDSVIVAVNEIKTPISSASLSEIENAETYYNMLSDDEKGMIAEIGNKLAGFRAEYLDAVKKEHVAQAIGAISAITNSNESVANARKIYLSLTAEEQALVTNYSILQEAETAVRQAAIDKHSSNFRLEYDKVQDVTGYIPQAMPKYVNTRSYVLPFIYIQSSDSIALALRYNYTGDSWIFWDNITVLADGEKFDREFGYFNITRKSGGGDVCEVYEQVLALYSPSLNIEELVEDITSHDIEILEAIANSTEAIVRFQGDNEHYDLTVKQSDKDAIKETLEFYKALTNHQ